jgi:hypothetical protein
MECDSIHSLIERKMKNKDAFVPQDFLNFTINARKNPSPLKAVLLDHTFFKNYDKGLFLKSIRPGTKSRDPKVIDIKAIKYESSKMFYKLSHNQNEIFKVIPGKINKQFNPNETFDSLFVEKIKLKRQKQEDLRSLKQSIPTEFHHYYSEIVENF